MNCGSSTTLVNTVSGNQMNNISLTAFGAGAVTALDAAGGRNEMSTNTMVGVTNAGTSGVNSLVSNATTVLMGCAVSSGQLMVVQGGLTVVQGDLTNDGILNHTGGNVFISGNFVNNGTFAQTLGDLEVQGDMLNAGQFTCSTGTVRLSGTGPQLVSGGLYFNLEVSGPGTKTLTDDVQVYNGVQMLTGILNTGANRVKLEPLATLTETDASYVLGRVETRRTPAPNATTDFGGLGLLMRPTAGATLPGSTLVSRVTGTAATGLPGSRAILRYFDVAATVPNGLNLTLTMKYLNHELNGIAPTDLRFFKSSDAGATWQNKGISGLSANAAVLNYVTGFSRWTLGDLQTPLPVELVSFRAERRGANALLTWATASERDNSGFGVEVSADGRTFRALTTVPSAGAGNTPHDYHYLDQEPGKTGLHYYRLRQTDSDGTTRYFGPQALTFIETVTLVAYPTRFAENLTVALNTPGTAEVELLDNLGRVVWQQPAVAAGTGPQALRPVCAAGSYTLVARVAGQVLRQRVEKE